MYELVMLKMEKKMLILVWKAEEVSLQEIANRLRKNKTTINCLVVKALAKRALEVSEKWTTL
jgi:hypothetical protein